MDMIDLRRLQAFLVVVEEGHVTRAAERLGMQQPPLSRLIGGLERDLGVLLLHRMARGVRPTEAGAALAGEARAVIERASRVADVVRRAARGEEGRLAIGFTSSAGFNPVVPEALRRYRALAPGVALQLEEDGTGELINALVHERLDAAFIRVETGPIPGITVEPVLKEPMLAALPLGHRLAIADAGPLPLGALRDEDFVLYRRPAGPGLYDAIQTACAQAGFVPRVVQEGPRPPATLSLVAAGLGVTIVPESLRRLDSEHIVYRALTDCPGLTAPLHLAWRRSSTRNPALDRFRRVVGQIAAAQSAAAQSTAAQSTALLRMDGSSANPHSAGDT